MQNMGGVVFPVGGAVQVATRLQAAGEQRDEWRKKIQPLWPAMVKEVGADGETLFKALDAGRAQCAG